MREPCRIARGQGQAPGFAGIIIAATALQHGLTILSQNLKHFAPLGVRVLDPFAALPPTYSAQKWNDLLVGRPAVNARRGS
jgi:hypothetical protein